DPPPDRDPARRGLDDPGEKAEERRLARAVPADEADGATGLDAERDVAERPDVRSLRPAAGDDQILQRPILTRIDAKAPRGVVEDVRPEPRLARRRLALERERPVGHSGTLGDETGRLEQLILVRVAELEDAGRQRVGAEDDVGVGAADLVREHAQERVVIVPA